MAAKTKTTLKLIHTVICDDARREDTGKFILIGVYFEDIVAFSLPMPFKLTVWLHFEVKLSGPIDMEIKADGESMREPVIQRITGPVPQPEMIDKLVPMPVIISMPMMLDKPGKFDISYKITGDSKWNIAKTVKVILGPLPVK